jgi:hypothetical protein
MGEALDSFALIATALARDPDTSRTPDTARQGHRGYRPFRFMADGSAELPEPQFGGVAPTGKEPAQPQVVPVESLELTLFALDLDRSALSDSFAAYGDPVDPLLPVSELARMLGLDIEVRPQERLITGKLGEARRPLTVDLEHGLAQMGGKVVPLVSGSAAVSLTDIYLKASVLKQLLPLDIEVDTDDYRIALTAKEKLPVQARADRQQRIYGLGDLNAPAEAVMQIDSPYSWLGRPAFDFSAELGSDNVRGGLISRLEGRVAADLLKTDFTGFFTTDDRGRAASARLLFQRRDPDGNLLGPLRATYAAAGDVFTPSLAIGPRSFGGAGAVISTARVDESNVFQRIDLRGELPLGYDVELYVNDVLYAGQTSPIQGRYEFANVPLVRGLNVIRVVTYGPQGEREESTRVLNVGGGQLPAGRTAFDFGVVRQDAPVIEFENGKLVDSGAAKGKLRLIANLSHGLTPGLTLATGLGLFSDRLGQSHQVLTAGVRTSLARTSVQFDYAKDLKGGSAFLFGAAGRLAGVSFIARHAEYQGRFIDETNTFFDLSRPMQRHSQLLLDFSLPFLGRQRLPLSGNIERTEFADGGTTLSARARTTLSVANTLVALGTDYVKRTGPGLTDERLTGTVGLSRLIDYKWQLRAAADYDVLPDAKLRSVSFTVDRELTRNSGIRFGLGQFYGIKTETSAQAAVFAHLPFGELSLNGNYTTEQRRWQVGLQLRFGLAHDPYKGGYRMTPPGPAQGGSVSMLAFVDQNGDRKMGPEDSPVPGIAIQGGARKVTTDARGRAFITGLGDSQRAILRTDTSDVDTLFTEVPPQNIAFMPRPGKVVQIPYPMFPTSEVSVRLDFQRADGSKVALAAVKLRLVPASGEAVTATTEFDGTAGFESIRPGRYRLELDPEQVQRLGIALAKPIELQVEPKGGQIVLNGEIVLLPRATP